MQFIVAAKALSLAHDTTSIIMFIDLIITLAHDESPEWTVALAGISSRFLRLDVVQSRHVAVFTGFCHLLAAAVFMEEIKDQEASVVASGQTVHSYQI